MSFEMPKYHHPDFTRPEFVNAPDVRFEAAEKARNRPGERRYGYPDRGYSRRN